VSQGPATTSAVWGRDDLTCPVPRVRIRQITRHARAHPWRGDTSLTDPRLMLDTTAITEPGRLTRVIFSFDYGYHQSGWFANSDYERCWHLSLSHPRPLVPRVYQMPRDVGTGSYVGMDVDTPTDDEARAWGRVFFGPSCALAWFEPAVGPGDPYRTPGVVHLRLYLDQQDRPIKPVGEVYHLRPWADGSSPTKVTEGRLGADVR